MSAAEQIQGWGLFVLSWAVFLGSHAIPARPPVRAWLVGKLGRKVYLTLYASVSVVLFAWVIVTAGQAPYVELWPYADWQTWVPNIVMPVACVLAVCGIGAPNPSLAGRGEFDAERPGIAGLTRHPVLFALGLWAAAHMVPNGDLAHVLMFAGFAALAGLGVMAFEGRNRRRYSADQWRALTRHTSVLPFVALASGRWRPDMRRLPIWRVLMGLAVWQGLLWLHPLVIGVSPLPAW